MLRLSISPSWKSAQRLLPHWPRAHELKCPTDDGSVRRRVGDAAPMLTADDGVSCLWIRAQDGHLDVVNALLEAGGRELAMMTTDNGASCLMISAQIGHLDVTNALLEAGGRELVMLTTDTGASCLSVARQANLGEVCRVLETACQNAGLSSHEITILKRG